MGWKLFDCEFFGPYFTGNFLTFVFQFTRIWIIRTLEQVTFLNTCTLLPSLRRISIASFVQARPTAPMAVTLLFMSISVLGANRLQPIFSFCRTECGQKRKYILTMF
jgi:hypothetical protein